jgi:hypothetical protein
MAEKRTDTQHEKKRREEVQGNNRRPEVNLTSKAQPHGLPHNTDHCDIADMLIYLYHAQSLIETVRVEPNRTGNEENARPYPCQTFQRGWDACAERRGWGACIWARKRTGHGCDVVMRERKGRVGRM